MAYTVKQLSILSGVSVRTLHFYDEIELLKPAYYGENGYRYYEEEQVLMLQQILFFKELEFDLEKIRELISDESFDKIETLKTHKRTLLNKISKTSLLIETIDKTIARLQGDKNVKDKDIYLGFDEKKQKEYEEYWIKQGETAKALVLESRRRTKTWKKEDFDKIKKETNQIHKEFTKLLKRKLDPSDNEVQQLVHRHYKMIDNFYTPTKEVYIGLGQIYVTDPKFRRTFDAHHVRLAEFMNDAMKIYAKRLS
ncbi:MAG: MerR family transcriptional regulator [Bacteriovoracia bacterium]